MSVFLENIELGICLDIKFQLIFRSAGFLRFLLGHAIVYAVLRLTFKNQICSKTLLLGKRAAIYIRELE